LRIAIVAALFLAAGHALAWDSISGNWCSKEDGCGKWHSLYKVEVEVIKSDERKRVERDLERGLKEWIQLLRIERRLVQLKEMEKDLFQLQWDRFLSRKVSDLSQLKHLRSRRNELLPEIEIRIRYRDIKLKRKPDLLQIIRGKIESGIIENGRVEESDGADVRVYKITARMGRGGGGLTADGAEPEIEGTITGTFKIEPGVFWKGTAPFRGTTAKRIVRKSIESGKEEEIEDTIEIEATIDGGRHPVKGVLKGKVRDGWRISGVYTPPPGDHCSYAGLRRAGPDWAKRTWLTMERKKLRDYEVKKLQELIQLEQLYSAQPGLKAMPLRKKAELDAIRKLEAVPRGGLLPEDLKAERDARLDVQPIPDSDEPPTVAWARKVPMRSPDERLGKFQRKIEGTINAKKDTITIKLPPLPVLNYRCEAGEVASDKEVKALILFRQGSIQHIELPGSGGDRPEGGRGGAADRGRP
jgi:hypothetical protein